MNISNHKNKKLSPINLRKYKQRKPLNNVNGINSFCNNNEFQMIQTMQNIFIECYIRLLSKAIVTDFMA